MTAFKIGLTTAGLTTLGSLTTPVLEPAWDYAPYSHEEVLGDLTVRGMGYPVAEWHWGYMTQNQYDQMKTFCSGKSASIYLVTKVDNDNYTTYSGSLVWPTNVRFGNNKAFDITLKFLKLEAA